MTPPKDRDLCRGPPTRRGGPLRTASRDLDAESCRRSEAARRAPSSLSSPLASSSLNLRSTSCGAPRPSLPVRVVPASAFAYGTALAFGTGALAVLAAREILGLRSAMDVRESAHERLRPLDAWLSRHGDAFEATSRRGDDSSVSWGALRVFSGGGGDR